VPEGDTVYRAAAKLDRALTGHRLTLSDFRVPSFATVDLREGSVIRTLSRGKHLLTRVDHQRAWTIHTHLKMEGSWHVYPDGERWRRPDTQVRLVLGIEGRKAVGFQLGIVELVPREQEADLVAHLGPDLLGPDWDEERALANLRDEPARPIGQALLDQRNLAGIGTIYRSETLFLSGVSPFLPLSAVGTLPTVVGLARRLLLANRPRPQITTTGNPRRGEQLWVYGRAGERCRRCRTPIKRAMQGQPPYDRVTFWCPSCQPG